MPRVKYDKAEVIADWKTGKFTERSLAHKHKISPATAHNIVAGLSKSLEPLISKQVEINHEVAKLPEQELSRFKQEVDERTKLETFFRNSHVLAAKTIATKIQRDGANAGYAELNSAVNGLSRAQESVLGKPPSVAIQVNNNGQQVTAVDIDRSPAGVRAAREFLDSVV